MSLFNASTQYVDNKGTVSVTWHTDNRLREFGKWLGLDEDYFAIGLGISRRFTINRSDPYEDDQATGKKNAHLAVQVIAIKNGVWGEANIPEYINSATPDELRSNLRIYHKEITSLDTVMDWFKQIDIRLLLPTLLDINLPSFSVDEVERVNLD